MPRRIGLRVTNRATTPRPSRVLRCSWQFGIQTSVRAPLADPSRPGCRGAGVAEPRRTQRYQLVHRPAHPLGPDPEPAVTNRVLHSPRQPSLRPTPAASPEYRDRPITSCDVGQCGNYRRKVDRAGARAGTIPSRAARNIERPPAWRKLCRSRQRAAAVAVPTGDVSGPISGSAGADGWCTCAHPIPDSPRRRPHTRVARPDGPARRPAGRLLRPADERRHWIGRAAGRTTRGLAADWADAGRALLDDWSPTPVRIRRRTCAATAFSGPSASRRAQFQAWPTLHRRIRPPQAGICAKPAAMRIAVGVSTPVSHGTRRLCAPLPNASRKRPGTKPQP